MDESVKNYLSRRRSVESRQLANMQLASFDMEIQLTGCPKSSESSLFDIEKKKSLYEKVFQSILQKFKAPLMKSLFETPKNLQMQDTD